MIILCFSVSNQALCEDKAPTTWGYVFALSAISNFHVVSLLNKLLIVLKTQFFFCGTCVKMPAAAAESASAHLSVVKANVSLDQKEYNSVRGRKAFKTSSEDTGPLLIE